MNKSNFLSAPLVAVAMIGGLSTAHADSADATCQVRKDGETKQGMSGPCTFSQRQGYIDLDLRNGETFSLSPTGQPNQFKDQKGKKVVRTQAGGDTQEFKWEGGKKVMVTFGASQAAGGNVTDTPADLKDLVHGRRVGGEVDDELIGRGWTQGKSEVQGSDVYSYWGKGSRCVVVRFDASRHVASIVNGMESSCR
jgi:hypothetical protein